MHILFVHKEYPGQYGHVARYLVERYGDRCTFVFNRLPARVERALEAAGTARTAGAPPVFVATTSSTAAAPAPASDPVEHGVRLVRYTTRGASNQSNPCGLHFEISMWHSEAVYHAMRARPDVRPDLIVGHSGFGTALYLADLYDRPLVSYCEWFFRTRASELDFRPEFPPTDLDVRRGRTHNATTLLNLDASAAGVSPTAWQRSRFPAEYRPKIETIFDGIDRTFWRRRTPPRVVAGRPIPEGVKVVTYVSYGFEASRGFDIFMRVAKRVCDARDDVIFVMVGSDHIYYGRDLNHVRARSFREHVLSLDDYDLSRFIFTGQVSEDQLVDILSLSDLHVYLTVPFVLSWSLMDALACGCTVLASDTPPVREMIRHEENGLLADFFDVDGLTRQALRVLEDPEQFRPLGRAGTAMIDERYSVEVVLPRLRAFYERVASSPRSTGV
jgi:glycosyltransferase involved in cell wall biosynthesis